MYARSLLGQKIRVGGEDGVGGKAKGERGVWERAGTWRMRGEHVRSRVICSRPLLRQTLFSTWCVRVEFQWVLFRRCSRLCFVGFVHACCSLVVFVQASSLRSGRCAYLGYSFLFSFAQHYKPNFSLTENHELVGHPVS